MDGGLCPRELWLWGDKYLDRQQIIEALDDVMDPELHRSLVALDMVQGVDISGNDVTVTIALTTKGCPLKAQIVQSVKTRLSALEGIGQIRVKLGEMSAEQRARLHNSGGAAPVTSLSDTTRIIAVASGKGGVGKSTVTVNLGAALRQAGYSVGILDCDVYGFSIPSMVGTVGKKPGVRAGKMMPIAAYGMKIMSMGYFVEDNAPVIWRGPMLGKMLRQFLEDVNWGNLDFLLLDLPPGTGDVALDVAQTLPGAGLLLVTTPQVVAAEVASRAAQMARKTDQCILGVVENMSSFICPHCGEPSPVFGTGGGEQLAAELGVPLLGQLPLTLEARSHGDIGHPVALADGPAAESYRLLAERVVEAVSAPVA